MKSPKPVVNGHSPPVHKPSDYRSWMEDAMSGDESTHLPQRAVELMLIAQGDRTLVCDQLIREFAAETAEPETVKEANLMAIARFCDIPPASAQRIRQRLVSNPNLRSELMRIAEIDDPLERVFALEELSTRSRRPTHQLEKLLKQLAVSAKPLQSLGVSAREYMEQSDAPISWIVPGLLPRGESVLLVAPPKAGKTLFSVDLIHSVVRGGEFLGEPVTQGRVLFISADESPRSTRLKLYQRGLGAQDGDNLRIANSFRIEQLALLEKTLEEYDPDVVVIDSLKSTSRGLAVSESSPEFAELVYDLKEVLGRHDAAGVLIHHERKSKAEDEGVAIDKVRGSSAIAGAAWGVLQLQPIRDSNERRLVATLRDAAPRNLIVTLNTETFHFEVLEDLDFPAGVASDKDRVLALLRSRSPVGFTKREIMDLTGISESSTKKVLSRLRDRNLVSGRQSTVEKMGFVYFVEAGDKTGDTGDNPQKLPGTTTGDTPSQKEACPPPLSPAETQSNQGILPTGDNFPTPRGAKAVPGTPKAGDNYRGQAGDNSEVSPTIAQLIEPNSTPVIHLLDVEPIGEDF